MALLRESEVYRAARRAKAARAAVTSQRILKEQTDPRQQHYDIFLSHSIKDADMVLGAKQILEDFGFTVYVDWIEDSDLDRSNVNRGAAEILRARMVCCDSLLYLHTKNSPTSKWMPWELGYFDGHNGNVAILPVASDSDEDTFHGQEYLSLYPYVDFAGIQGGTGNAAWVNRSSSRYMNYQSWKKGNRTWKAA